MAVLLHEVWVEPNGCNSLILAGELGADARKILAPGARVVHRFLASSHVEAMTIYNAFLGREPYVSSFPEEDTKPYPDAWFVPNHPKDPTERLKQEIQTVEQLARGWAVKYAHGGPVVTWNQVLFVEAHEIPVHAPSLSGARLWSPEEYAPRFAQLLRESRSDWINLGAEGVLDDALVIVVQHRWDNLPMDPPMFVHVMPCGPSIMSGFVRFTR